MAGYCATHSDEVLTGEGCRICRAIERNKKMLEAANAQQPTTQPVNENMVAPSSITQPTLRPADIQPVEFIPYVAATAVTEAGAVKYARAFELARIKVSQFRTQYQELKNKLEELKAEGAKAGEEEKAAKLELENYIKSLGA